MKFLYAFFLIFGSLQSRSQSSWFVDVTKSCTVYLEAEVNGSYNSLGTGFLFMDTSDKTQLTVVTAAHLMQYDHVYITFARKNDLASSNNTYLNIGPMSQTDEERDDDFFIKFPGKIRYRKKLIPYKTFLTDTSLDVSIFKITPPIGKILDSIFLGIDAFAVGSNNTRSSEKIAVGTDVFFLGFPFGFGTEFNDIYNDKVMNPIVRSGSVAYKSENTPFFLLDGFSFGGNSGSPIFTKPSFGFNEVFLIGMVINHVSEKTKTNVNINGEEIYAETNIGLTKCIWIEDIMRLVANGKNLK